MTAIAYLKQQCGWSRGVREVLAKYGIEYEERQIHIQENYSEMILKTGQTQQPCVELDGNVMLVDVSGEELQEYLIETGFDPVCVNFNVPLDRACSEIEHEQQRQAMNDIPVKDTIFSKGF